MIQFRKNSYAVRLLYYLSLCGEFPYHSISLLGEHPRCLVRVIRKMKDESYISLIGKGKYKTIRLMSSGIKTIKNVLGKNYYEHYMQITNNNHFVGCGFSKKHISQGEKITLRNHRVAEILCMADCIGCSVFPFQKPKLSPYLNPQLTNRNLYFYTSKELKNVDPNQKKKVSFTRLVGTFFLPGGAFNCYNINDKTIKWQNYGENKMQYLIKEIAKNNVVHYERKWKIMDMESAFIFGKNDKAILKILNEKQKKQHRTEDFEYLCLDGVYKNLYYIPLNSHGKNMLKLFSKIDWYPKMIKILFGDNIDWKKHLNDYYDIETSKYKIVVFLSGNLKNIKYTKNIIPFENKLHFIVCFAYQQEFLQTYFEDTNVKIKVVNEINFYKSFLKEDSYKC